VIRLVVLGFRNRIASSHNAFRSYPDGDVVVFAIAIVIVAIESGYSMVESIRSCGCSARICRVPKRHEAVHKESSETGLA